ncbi:MAG: hypothetical protein UH850_00395 [Paludibacteraceae bacterium]|jgi:hypothetical protein|nr:hypothetical protein [Paludibacteraceae bacterium]
MINSKLNISKIETYLHSIIDNVVSNNTYVGTPPETIKEDWQDMCVIDLGSDIVDFNAYGKGVVLVWLYARPLATGAKNVAKMSELETKLNEVIDTARNSTYRINRNATYTDYDSERKWHCNIVELNLTIV